MLLKVFLHSFTDCEKINDNILFCQSTLAPSFLRSSHIDLSTNQKTAQSIDQSETKLSCPLLLQVCASLTHLSWHLTSVRVTIRNSVTKTYFLRAGDRSDQACDWNVIINTRVMIVWGLIESDYILPSPRVGRLSRLLASDWPEPHSPGFWLADNKTARCDSGQGQLPVIASLLPALSEPMRAQYWGHVTCTDQSEAGITLYCTDTRKQRQVWGRWGLIANEKIYNLPFLLWEEILFGKILLGSSFYQTSFQ